MPSFHSTLPSSGKSYGNIALMPLRQTSKGTARGPAPPSTQEDIVDQTIGLFKVNNFSVIRISTSLSSGQHSLQTVRHGD